MKPANLTLKGLVSFIMIKLALYFGGSMSGIPYRSRLWTKVRDATTPPDSLIAYRQDLAGNIGEVVSHGLGTKDIVAIVYDKITGDEISVDITRVDANTVRLDNNEQLPSPSRILIIK
jgi:hypothetical protein